ncbi:hypothetical protein NMY22_g5923 [Coprinellus aureogranulatus]|nr:hypothetical protein NMY22_g5923 [Coprinellus aureogranulatus]
MLLLGLHLKSHNILFSNLPATMSTAPSRDGEGPTPAATASRSRMQPDAVYAAASPASTPPSVHKHSNVYESYSTHHQPVFTGPGHVQYRESPLLRICQSGFHSFTTSGWLYRSEIALRRSGGRWVYQSEGDEPSTAQLPKKGDREPEKPQLSVPADVEETSRDFEEELKLAFQGFLSKEHHPWKAVKKSGEEGPCHPSSPVQNHEALDQSPFRLHPAAHVEKGLVTSFSPSHTIIWRASHLSSIMSSTGAEATLNTARLSENPLRKRMNILHRAHSLTSLRTPNRKNLPGLSGMAHQKLGDRKEEEEDGSGDSSPLEYESRAESSEEEKKPKKTAVHKAGSSSSKSQARPQHPPPRPKVNTTSLHSPGTSHWKGEPSPMSPTSRSWYEFDLAVVVALVSPVGNWLTGGDHIKNLLLIVLLIFYLHQIIEIPWSLYRKARPRRRSPQFPPSPSEPIEARYSHLAATELQRLELFFLFCTLISPLCGALLLRYATSAVLGPDAVSWFSTGLFVLATGMRPWAHLVDRLNERTSELHDFIHYPEVVTAHDKHDPTEELEKRIAKLEKSLAKLKKNVVRATEELYDYVDDAVDALQGDIRDTGKRQNEKISQIRESLEHRAPLARIGSLITPAWVMRSLPATVRRLSATAVPTHKTHPTVTVTSPTPPSSSSRSPSPRSATLLNIAEDEEVVYESFPLLVRPVVYASRVASQLISLLLSPFSAAMRLMFGRY